MGMVADELRDAAKVSPHGLGIDDGIGMDKVDVILRGDRRVDGGADQIFDQSFERQSSQQNFMSGAQ